MRCGNIHVNYSDIVRTVRAAQSTRKSTDMSTFEELLNFALFAMAGTVILAWIVLPFLLLGRLNKLIDSQRRLEWFAEQLLRVEDSKRPQPAPELQVRDNAA